MSAFEVALAPGFVQGFEQTDVALTAQLLRPSHDRKTAADGL